MRLTTGSYLMHGLPRVLRSAGRKAALSPCVLALIGVCGRHLSLFFRLRAAMRGFYVLSEYPTQRRLNTFQKGKVADGTAFYSTSGYQMRRENRAAHSGLIVSSTFRLAE
jgi:hypothetical protein